MCTSSKHISRQDSSENLFSLALRTRTTPQVILVCHIFFIFVFHASWSGYCLWKSHLPRACSSPCHVHLPAPACALAHIHLPTPACQPMSVHLRGTPFCPQTLLRTTTRLCSHLEHPLHKSHRVRARPSRLVGCNGGGACHAATAVATATATMRRQRDGDDAATTAR